MSAQNNRPRDWAHLVMSRSGGSQAKPENRLDQSLANQAESISRGHLPDSGTDPFL